MPPIPSAKAGAGASLPPPPLPKAPTMAPKKQATLWNEGDDDEEEEQSSFLKKPAPPLPPPQAAKKPINKFFGGDDDDEEEETFNIGKKPLPKMAMPIPAPKTNAAPPAPPRKTNPLFDSVVSQGDEDSVAPPKLPMPKVGAPPAPPAPPKPNFFKNDYGDEDEDDFKP